jgi:hypothetical protein
MHRRYRRLFAWPALFLLCFAQVALSAHACSVLQGALPAEVAMAHHHAPCGEVPGPVDDTPSPPCADHCQETVQATAQPLPVPPTAPTFVTVLVVPAVSSAGLVLAVPAYPLHPPPDARPVFASSNRLRI